MKKKKFCCLSRNCYCKGTSYKVVFPCQGPTQCNPWLQVGVQDWCSSDSSLEYPHRSLHHMLTMVTTCYIHRQLEDEQIESLCYCRFHIPRIPRIIDLIKTSCVDQSIVARKNVHHLVWPYWHSFFFLTKNKTSHLILPLFTGPTQVSSHLDKFVQVLKHLWNPFPHVLEEGPKPLQGLNPSSVVSETEHLEFFFVWLKVLYHPLANI